MATQLRNAAHRARAPFRDCGVTRFRVPGSPPSYFSMGAKVKESTYALKGESLGTRLPSYIELLTCLSTRLYNGRLRSNVAVMCKRAWIPRFLLRMRQQCIYTRPVSPPQKMAWNGTRPEEVRQHHVSLRVADVFKNYTALLSACACSCHIPLDPRGLRMRAEG